MLFASRTAEVSLFQGEDELTGVRAGHGGYDFTVPCQTGDVLVRYTNTTAAAVSATIDGCEPVEVAAGQSHDFTVNVPTNKTTMMEWGTRNATIRFKV